MSQSELSQTQIAILDGLEEGKPLDEISRDLGIIDAQQIYRRALRMLPKIELMKRWPNVYFSTTQLQRAPIDKQTFEEAQVAGLPNALLKEVKKRILARTANAHVSATRLSERETIGALESRLHVALQYLDDFALSAASAKDLSIVIDTLIENIQLLKGKPTSILSIEDRRKLNELIPAVILEAKRRGVPVEDAEIVKR